MIVKHCSDKYGVNRYSLSFDRKTSDPTPTPVAMRSMCSDPINSYIDIMLRDISYIVGSQLKH